VKFQRCAREQTDTHTQTDTPTDRHTDRPTDRNAPLPYSGRVTEIIILIISVAEGTRVDGKEQEQLDK